MGETISLIETGSPATRLDTILAVLSALDLEFRVAPRSKGAAVRNRRSVLMPRRRQHPPLRVHLNNRLVGHLLKEPSGAISFRYDAAWLSWDSAIPVSLSLPLREDAKQMKLAMAVGTTNHYRIETIHGRHFVQTGVKAGLPKALAGEALAEIAATADKAIAHVEKTLPARFPARIHESVKAAMTKLNASPV